MQFIGNIHVVYIRLSNDHIHSHEEVVMGTRMVVVEVMGVIACSISSTLQCMLTMDTKIHSWNVLRNNMLNPSVHGQSIHIEGSQRTHCSRTSNRTNLAHCCGVLL